MIQTAKGFKILTAAGDNMNNSPWVPDFVENPYKDTTAALNTFNDNMAAIGYWLNPKNLFTEIWQGLETLIYSPDTAVFLMVAAIIALIFRVFDVKTPFKVVFWTWVAYWILRGFIFV